MIRRLPTFTPHLRPLVRNGRKRETRRMSKLNEINEGPDGWYLNGPGRGGVFQFVRHSDGKRLDIRCPYPKPGEIAVMPEPWRVGAWREHGPTTDSHRRNHKSYMQIAVDYRDSPEILRTPWCDVPDADQFRRLVQQSIADFVEAQEADEGGERYYEDDGLHWTPGDSPCRWRTSMHMPIWAGRTKVRVTDAEPQRLHDITEEQAIAEGIERYFGHTWRNYHPDSTVDDGYKSPIDSFLSLFDSIHGQELVDSNPWVWRLAWEAIDS